MANKQVIIILSLTIVTLVNGLIEMTDQCRSSQDCGPGRCCTVSRQRYPIPTCTPMRVEGSTCIPTQAATESFNTTLTYPNGDKIDVTNVYDLICPCDVGLVCTRPSGTCTAISA